MKDNVLEKVNSILSKYDQDDAFVMATRKFLDTYEGDNETEFVLMFINFIDIVNENIELKIKAKAYDDILQIKHGFDEKMDRIKQEFEAIENEESKMLITMDKGYDGNNPKQPTQQQSNTTTQNPNPTQNPAPQPDQLQPTQ